MLLSTEFACAAEKAHDFASEWIWPAGRTAPMATTLESANGAREAASVGHRRSKIYFRLSIACALVAVVGFLPTYWLQVPYGTFKGPPLIHIHAALATGWVLFLLSQSSLVTTGKVRSHRDWGLAGIALASMIVMLGFAVAIYGMNQRIAHNIGSLEASRRFLIVPVSSILLFAGFTAAAIANVKRPEWHRRLMIVGTVSLIAAAAARIPFVLATGGGPGIRPGLFPPPSVSIATPTSLLLELLIVAGMIHDWRSMRRIHSAWIVGASVTSAVILLRVPFSRSEAWTASADWLGRIAS
jgi:hypothetical protein